jgi:hypothetical protein
MEEGAQGSQTTIAGSHAIAPGFFEVLEESEQVGGAQVIKSQLIWTLAAGALKKIQQKTEGVAIDGHGSQTHIALFDQVVTEESLNEASKSFRGIHKSMGRGVFELSDRSRKEFGYCREIPVGVANPFMAQIAGKPVNPIFLAGHPPPPF